MAPQGETRAQARREGKAGRDAFHRERKVWFKMATRSRDYPDGIELAGTLSEQNTQYDIVARRFRTYRDGRPGSSSVN